jgi:hypothetical protein
MSTCQPNDDDTQKLVRCATCATIAETDCRGAADANTVCATCGLPMVDWIYERGSYFEVIMRLGRPGPAMWPRRNS